MRQQPSFDAAWCAPYAVNDSGIVVGGSSSFGVGALLVLRCKATNRILMGRKSYRKGFEGSNQFTFPGGMVRASGKVVLDQCVYQSLQERVRKEVGLEISTLSGLSPLDDWPPIVARYTIQSTRAVSVAILPFCAEVPGEIVAAANDSSVYAVRWYEPLAILAEVTKTNALILAQYLWTELSDSERDWMKGKLQRHYLDAVADAKLVGAARPRAAWA